MATKLPKTTKVIWFYGLNVVGRETRMTTGASLMDHVDRRGRSLYFMAHCPRTGERAWREPATGQWREGTPEDGIRSEMHRICVNAHAAGSPGKWGRLCGWACALDDAGLREQVIRMERGVSLNQVARTILRDILYYEAREWGDWECEELAAA